MSAFTDTLGAVARTVAASADELNRLDGQAGDGDLGVTMRTASTIVIDLIEELEAQSVPAALWTCGQALARGAPSTAGTLVATGFLRAAKAAESSELAPSADSLASLLEAAVEGITERGKAARGSRTMLDALGPAADAARASAARGESIVDALAQAAAAAEAGARATAGMRAVHGRAGWLADRSTGHEDAGARLVAIAVGAAAEAAAARRRDAPPT